MTRGREINGVESGVISVLGEMDAISPEKPNVRLTGRKLGMLLCCSGAPFMIMLDTNIVAVSLPSIARDLHGQFTDVEWVVSAYILPFAAFLMPAGALADLLGRRSMLLLGLSLFTAASLLCGLAPNLLVLNGARALQAVGASLQLTASLAIIGHGFEVYERARVYAIWGTVMGIAPSLGPVLGGIITSWLGWRWAFYINLPIGIVLISLVVWSVDESRDPQAGRLDVRGILLFGTGLSSIVWALIDANAVGWGNGSTILKLAIGVILLIALVFAERSHPRPMIDLSLFKDETVIGAAISMLGYAAAAQVMMTVLPIYLQDAFGQSPMQAGLAMIPFALPLLIGPGIGGKLAAYLSSRALLTIGLGIVALGDAILAAAVYSGLGYWGVVPGMFVTGCGAGILNSETTKAQIASIPADRSGMASGFAGTTRFIGIILGLAGLGAILAATAEKSLRQLGTQVLSTGGFDWRLLSLRIVGGDARGALAELTGEVREALGHAVRGSITAGFSLTFATTAGIATVSSILVWYLVRAAKPESSFPRNC